MRRQALENVAQVWRKKQLLKAELNEALGEYQLSPTAQDVFVYIAATSKTNISGIRQNTYFSNKSFSTIKRAVLELKQSGLVDTTQDTVDKRVAWLTPVEGA